MTTETEKNVNEAVEQEFVYENEETAAEENKQNEGENPPTPQQINNNVDKNLMMIAH